MSMIITGSEAISYARAKGVTINKFEDPTAPARYGLSIEEAEEVAREDPGLVYLEFLGWNSDDDVNGYFVTDYFVGGEYLGKDNYGIEPIFE